MAKHVMIVDDDASNRDFLSTVLKKHGYTATTARDGVDGLKLAKETPPDLFVLDVMMPRKTGFVLFKQLKTDENLKDIPVIMLTAIAGVMEEDASKDRNWTLGEIKEAFHEKMQKMVEHYRSDADMTPEKFLDKPIAPDKFIEAVKEIFGEAG